jgi:ketosteroid isomerase-like protein
MRAFLGVLCLGLASAGAVQAATASGPAAVVRQFIDTFNKGDVNGAAATHTASATIIDEVAPHIWTGDGAVKAWAADLEKNDKAAGISGETVKLGKAIRTQIDGDTGYVVIPATYTYKQHGKAMVETASMTYALRKDADAWKITGWSWNGTPPHPVAAKPAGAAPAMSKPEAPTQK